MNYQNYVNYNRVSKITFYANLAGCYENKLFSFRIVSLASGLEILRHFRNQGNKIKTVFIKGVGAVDGVPVQQKIINDFLADFNDGVDLSEGDLLSNLY